MARLPSRRLRLAALAGALAPIAALGVAPASANHEFNSCNNDPAGTDEVYVVAHNLAFVGVDAGLTSTPAAVCVVGPTTNVAGLVYVFDRPSLVGRTVALQLCTPTCTTVLNETGAGINTSAPLFSCVWVNGVQQNPGCP